MPKAISVRKGTSKSASVSRIPRWKYLRRARMEEDSDWFWAISRAYLFTVDQIRKRNYYAATVVESSLREISLKFLMLLDIHVRANFEDQSESARVEQLSKRIFNESFARNIDRASEMNLISRRLKISLHKFRETRNGMIHEALFGEISGNRAKRLVSKGHEIMGMLGGKIAKLRKNL